MVNGAPVAGLTPTHNSRPGKKPGKTNEILSLSLAVQEGEETKVKSFMFRVKDGAIAGRAMQALNEALKRT